MVVAIGNGAISSTSDLGTMPTDQNVNSVITSDNSTYSDVHSKSILIDTSR